jgi:hypothetical protein
VEWDGIFPESILQSTTAGVSDHCPLILGLKVHTGGKLQFHFESFWTKVAFKKQLNRTGRLLCSQIAQLSAYF